MADHHSSAEWKQLWSELESVKEANMSGFDKSKIAETKFTSKKDFGIGAAMMGDYQDPLRGLSAEIRGGMSHIEFAPSIGQGGYSSFTKISAEKRQAMRELKKINKMSMSTHAHAGVSGLSGFDEKNFSFDERQRQFGVDEVKKAIDFAADVAEGGSITFHAGEFARPLAGQVWGEKGEEFQMSQDEKDNMMFAVIDKETKRYAEGGIFRGDQKVVVPVLDYSDMVPLSGMSTKDSKMIVPQIVTEGGSVQTESFDSFQKYAGWLAENDKDFQGMVKDKLKMDASALKKSVNGAAEINSYEILEIAAKKRHKDAQMTKLSQQVSEISRSLNTQEADINEVDKIVSMAKKMSKSSGAVFYIPKEVRNVARYGHTVKEALGNLSEEQMQKQIDSGEAIASDYIVVSGDEIKGNAGSNTYFNTFYAGSVDALSVGERKKQLDTVRASQEAQIVQEYDKLVKNDQYATTSEFALEQNKKSFAQLGVELYEKNKALEKRNKNAEKMYFAVENLFPEKYGSHPEELLKVINNAREAMAEKIANQYKMGMKEAKGIAKDSIKATFDTGHLHMWKKYFTRRDKESESEYTERFNKWALGQTQKLVDEGVIGNIHLADNFGFDDDHVTLGQGTVPIKEYMEMFDKARGAGLIKGKFSVEGFDESKQRHGVHEAWKQSGAEFFRQQDATDKWINFESDSGRRYGYAQAQNSYVNSYNKPSFIFGQYAPNQEEWGPWDGLGLE